MDPLLGKTRRQNIGSPTEAIASDAGATNNPVTASLAYPSTGYDPSPVVDFQFARGRERLSPSALKSSFNIIERWTCAMRMRQLLGERALLRGGKAPVGRVLETDKLLRTSYLVGIFKGLSIKRLRG